MLLFLILIIVACVVMAFFILVQNPKGGGLSGSIAGFSTQFMGVKQTTDVLEKGTWVLASVIIILCLVSTFFISGGEAVRDRIDAASGPIPAQPQQNQQPQGNPNNGTFPGSAPNPNAK